MFTLLFIAMCFAMTVAFVLIRRLQDKPWTQHGILEGSQDGLTSSAPKVGLWVFLGVVTSVFLVFIGAYFMRMDMSHGGMAAGEMQGWVPVEEPRILWANTVALVLASIAIQLAHGFSSSTQGRAKMRRYFNMAGLLTMSFLIGQVLAWQALYATGEYAATTVSFAFFVLLTAVHGAHLVGGLVVWSRAASRIRRGLEQAELHEVAALRQSIQLCATYWHYLLMIWLVLFAILLST
ncbi:MAG TPA: cytochrome-c oxidase [Gammaproteobacteria bacterium]|jgi:cytochrome c oxidase subunit 3